MGRHEELPGGAFARSRWSRSTFRGAARIRDRRAAFRAGSRSCPARPGSRSRNGRRRDHVPARGRLDTGAAPDRTSVHSARDDEDAHAALGARARQRWSRRRPLHGPRLHASHPAARRWPTSWRGWSARGWRSRTANPPKVSRCSTSSRRAFLTRRWFPRRPMLRIEALIAAGDPSAAQRAADGFLAAHPGSPYEPRIRSLLGGASNR